MGDKTQEANGGGRPTEEAVDASQGRSNGDSGNYTATGSSTGKDADNYVFADPEQLHAVIGQWHSESDAMKQDHSGFQMARAGAAISATDVISTGYFDTVCSVLQEFIDHNGTMVRYTDTYTKKLADSQSGMAENDNANAAEFHSGY